MTPDNYSRFSVTVETPPAAPAVTRADAKLHLRIDHDADDSVIDRLIAVATAMVESATGLALITRRLKLTADDWPGMTEPLGWWDGVREGAAPRTAARQISLPQPPLQSVDSITVFDADGIGSVMSPSLYFTEALGQPGRLVFRPAADLSPPGLLAGGIEIVITCGYGDTEADVPPGLKQAILLLVAHLYSNRGDVPALALDRSGAQSLIAPYVKMRLA